MIFSDKQNQYIREASRRWNIKSGATRSGKTYLDQRFIIPARVRERAGKEGLTVILGVTRDTIERNVLEPMRALYGEELVGEINSRNICRLFGEKVHCFGAEKVSQVSKIRGSSIKYAYGDEVADWSQEVFELLKSRLDKPYSCFDGTLNPQHPTHWLKGFLDSDVDIYLQEYTIFDNPYLSKEFVDNLCKEYEGTIYYDRYILGQWKRAEGAIYRRYADNPQSFRCEIVEKVDTSAKVKQIALSDIEQINAAIDFGGNRSGHALVATGRTESGMIIPLKSRRYEGSFEPQDIDRFAISFLDEMMEKYERVDCLYWDNAESVLGKGLETAVGKVYPNIIVRPARKMPVNERIRCTVRLMGAGKFYMTNDCETLSTALCEAVWNAKSIDDERLDDYSSDIDSLDAFEYTFERDIKRLVTA